MNKISTKPIDVVGGPAKIRDLANRFYVRVLGDSLLRPLFSDPNEPHAERMALWLIELFGGERDHTRTRGGFGTMVHAHSGLGITEEQRSRWVEHMLSAIAELEFPQALGESFKSYIETSSHFAKRQSESK